MAQMSPFYFLFRQTRRLEFKEENGQQQLLLHFFAQEPPKIDSFPYLVKHKVKQHIKEQKSPSFATYPV